MKGFIVFVIAIACTQAGASIPEPMRELKEVPAAVRPLHNDALFTSTFIQTVIPTGMAQTEDSDVVKSQIMDHSFKSVLSGDLFRNSPLGKLATKIERAAQPNLSVGSGKPNSVTHKFDLQFEPKQQTAKLNYSGLLDSNFAYDIPTDYLRVYTRAQVSSRAHLSLAYETRLQTSDEKTTRLIYSVGF